MFKRFSSLLKAGQGKQLKKYESLIEKTNSLEKEFEAMDDEALKGLKQVFMERHQKGESLQELMPEAFAVVREAAKRALSMRHFDVQIMGGAVLFEGKIAEMKTGEGKTLAATLPVYLNSITRKSTHIVTVNDYLAKRDSEWMGKVYERLGVSVGLILNSMDPHEKRAQYRCDVVYGTNNEFGFDYLRDNMVISKDDMVQNGHPYAIIDEVDSILIDEARTPLIISGIAYETTELYRSFSRIVPRLSKGEDYEVDEKQRTVSVTEEGVARVEKITGIENLYDPSNYLHIHALNQSLKAQNLFRRDVDYIVKDGEVLIIDEFTGRILPGRRYSEGLHQAIEAKENVKIKEENQTLATITIQNYFRMYEKLAGMTGTAITESAEFRHIYKLETVVIPTNMPMIRDDQEDLIYKDEQAKFEAVVQDIQARHKEGQPVLVGTISIEKSERLSDMLKRVGVPHHVLNARYHEKEAEIIAQAGQPHAVTIATNMAGRGTDIVLGEGVTGKGGLHVLGTERHESRRIDNQLRGRSGRQGDPGSSEFYLSLEDDLLRLFGSDRIGWVMERFRFPDDMPIAHPVINKSIENAQRQVESRNFEIRKHVLEYDDVMNRQREIIYEKRKKVLLEDDARQTAMEMVRQLVSDTFDAGLPANLHQEEWDIGEFSALMGDLFGKDILPGMLSKKAVEEGVIDRKAAKETLTENAMDLYAKREAEYGEDIMRRLEKMVMLNVIDNRWREHLLEMDYLKEGIGLRAIGQRDPLVEYKHESFHLFRSLMEEIKNDTVKLLYNARLVSAEDVQREKQRQFRNLQETGPGDAPSPVQREPVTAGAKVGRNDPCPCGSGKKYKKCCGS